MIKLRHNGGNMVVLADAAGLVDLLADALTSIGVCVGWEVM